MISAITSMAGGLVAVGQHLCGFIYPKIKSMIRFRSNLEKLRKEMGNLLSLGNNLKGQIEAAERSGHVAAPAVTKWLEEFENIKNEVNSIEASVESNGGKCCPTTPSCCLGCTLGVKVDKNLTGVRRLIEAANFPTGMVVENYKVKKVEHIPGPSIAGQSTASKNLMKVMDLLNNDDDGVSRIGVWGMGGVGKTTLVKNLNNQLETAAASCQPFSIIIWVTVSKELDLKRLQTQLLERLNLVVKAGESMESTASRLHERFQREKRFLLILDDVWEAIDLDYLGVPQTQPEFRMGNKVILTSRSLDVCRQMKTDVDVKVDVLNEEESWQLFTQNAGKVATLPHIEPISRKVSKECSGLPLAIIIVGASMRGKTMETLWNDALNALEMSVPSIQGIEYKVYKHLKWSYDSLFFQGIDIKSCFLYCSLYPEDFSIEVRELVHCWIAEGLVVVRKSYEDSMNRGIALVENLKDSCLLEDGIFNHTVKMHDVVRDVAIWIASSSELDGCKSFVQSGIGLNQISEAELSESLHRVSFMENKITRLPDCAIRCPKVSSLLLQGNLPLEIVPEEFLFGFPALRVLNLSETRIHTLPLSVIQLYKLEALLLQGCQNLKELPPLGTLHRLQVLNCSSTNLEALPEGMENLTDLRLLDLSDTHHFIHIPNGIISQLSHLETINMTDSFYKWSGKRSKEELGTTPIDELGCLDQLTALFINLNSSYLTFEDLSWIKRLKRFHFVIGHADEKLLVQQKYEEKRVTLCGVDFSGECYWANRLVENASNLTLDNCLNLGKIPTHLAKKCNSFIGLKSLTITDYYGEFPLARESGDDRSDLLPNLQELVLHEVWCLLSISGLAHLLKLRLSTLRKISLSRCRSLQYLVASSGTLKNLEEVTISSCRLFAELFEYASSSQSFKDLLEHASSGQSFEDFFEHATSSQTFVPSCLVPNLRIMKLKELPELATLGGQHQSWQHLEKLEVINCNQIKKLPFTTQNATAIKEIRGTSQWWNDLAWDDEDTKSGLQQYFKPY
ncbi:Disease resistance protein [Camellia lanceoleosa]|uniref:Disease resistance protein n=1 Tax=Camellia lanceoleosa TaxID=1840588 RepID=A0ACC0H789_9ERIC|nr:Disease resistance protein [Camellia lanceoleosa]